MVTRQVRHILRRHLFLSIGVLSLALFFLVAALNRAGQPALAQTLAGPMHVLIVPGYLVWLLISMALLAVTGPQGPPHSLATLVSAFSMIAGLAPYALLDHFLHRLRLHSASRLPPPVRDI